MKYSVIILAAGNGTRMNLGYNKMLLKIKDKPIITLSIQKFLNDKNCSEIIIVINKKEQCEIEHILKEENLLLNKCKIVHGSYERQYSVYNGLKHVNNDIVLVHDGARPFISENLINELVKESNEFNCAVPGVKVKDTIKIVKNSFIEETLPREFLHAVQTPQACKSLYLMKAHEIANKENYLGTDEANLIEKYTSIKAKVINSSYDNIKITTKEDLVYAEKLYPKYYK